MRHERQEPRFHRWREHAKTIRREVFECAFSPWTCTYPSIAKDGAGVEDGFSKDAANNWWIREEHVGIENDDRVPEGEERDDDLPPDDQEDDDDGTCGVDAPATVEPEGAEDDEDPLTDEAEAATLLAAEAGSRHTGAEPRPRSAAEYERYLREVEMPPAERRARPAEGTVVPPIGEVVLPGVVPAL